MHSEIEIFYGSLSSTAGGLLKLLQGATINISSLEEAKEQVNKFLADESIEVISVSHQYNDGLLSILIHYKNKEGDSN